MLFDLIERLRQKPLRQKKRIAFLAAFSFSGLIFVVWLSVIMPNFMQKERQEKKAFSAQPSPSGAVGSNISSGWSELRAEVGAMRDYIEGVVDGTDHYAASSTPPSQEAAVFMGQNIASTTVSTTTEE